MESGGVGVEIDLTRVTTGITTARLRHRTLRTTKKISMTGRKSNDYRVSLLCCVTQRPVNWPTKDYMIALVNLPDLSQGTASLVHRI
ncbi:hypothetical protein KIN20_017242 [Parelaphostrongylus tenuis]|uniref:Uncharacterized protein n=1 Tax=Parelaphostrongylus tenuis TaxID=148309 RepID=A0AAD5MHP5_PARTN|nr:hypothetical protein KIN20_017242 [Parelaphostrongylus tenuis]